MYDFASCCGIGATLAAMIPPAGPPSLAAVGIGFLVFSAAGHLITKALEDW